MSGVIYPINNKKYTAEDVEIFNCTRTSGVYSVLDFDCVLNGSVLTVDKGLAWMKNGDFKGKAVAFTEPVELVLEGAEAELDRYDVVAIRYDATKTEPEMVIITGEPAENPKIPEVSRETYLYELFLYAILRKAGESFPSSENIEDLRENEAYCGIMRDSVTSSSAPVYETLYEGDGLVVGDSVGFVIDKYEYLIATLDSSAGMHGRGNAFLTRGQDRMKQAAGQASKPRETFSGGIDVQVGSGSDREPFLFFANLTISESGATVENTMPSTAKIIKLVGVTKQPEGYVKVDGIYNPKSKNAQSGEGVAEAAAGAVEIAIEAAKSSFNNMKYGYRFEVGAIDSTSGANVPSTTKIRSEPICFDLDTEVNWDTEKYSCSMFVYDDPECTVLNSRKYTNTQTPFTVPKGLYVKLLFGTSEEKIEDAYKNDIYESIVFSNDANLADKIFVKNAVKSFETSILIDVSTEDVFIDKTTRPNTYFNTFKKCSDPSAWYTNNSFTTSNVNLIEPNRTYQCISFKNNNGAAQMFCDAMFFDETYTFISKVQNTKSFTTPDNAVYLVLTFYNTSYSSSNGVDDLNTVIIEKSDELTYPLRVDRLNNIRAYTGYEDKKWMCIGDSITERNFRTLANYHDFISEELGIKIINCGVSGSGYKIHDTDDDYLENCLPFYKRISGYSEYEPDIITIMGGINDLMFSSKEMGEITDTTTDTWFGCVYALIENIKSTFPNIPFGIMSPLPQENYNTSDKNNEEYVFVQKLEEFCDYYNVPFLNQYNKSGFRPWDEDFKLKYTSCNETPEGDGLHPNVNGHRLIYPRIREFLKTLI